MNYNAQNNRQNASANTTPATSKMETDTAPFFTAIHDIAPNRAIGNGGTTPGDSSNNTAGSDTSASTATANQPSSFINVQNLSLPKGGGAIQGIGEQWKVDDFTGSASLTIPIGITHCRDFTPQLALSYSSGSGNSPFGLGMQLGIPSILRKTSNGIPRYDDTDIFMQAGGDYLAPVHGKTNIQRTLPHDNDTKYRVTTYRLSIESSFALIEHWVAQEKTPVLTKGESDDFWRVTDPNHTVHVFGVTEKARIADPNDPTRIFQWLLEESYDARGQHHWYTYKSEDTAGIDITQAPEKNHIQAAQKYVQSIRYGNTIAIQDSMVLMDHPDVQNTPESNKQWHFEVLFDYGEYGNVPLLSHGNHEDIVPLASDQHLDQPTQPWSKRSDSFSTYRAGFEMRTHRLCQRTLLFHRFEKALGTNPILVHSTTYQYATTQHAQLSKMTAVQSTGYQHTPAHGNQTATYFIQQRPPIILNHQPFQPENVTTYPLQDTQGKAPIGMNSPPYSTLVDLYSEGVPGIFYHDGRQVLYQAACLIDVTQHTANIYATESTTPAAPITYNTPKPLEHFPIYDQLAVNKATLIDVNSNGKLDLMVTAGGLKGYYEAKSNHQWKGFQSFTTCPTDVDVPQQEWVDLSGNGLNDRVMLNGSQLRVYPALCTNQTTTTSADESITAALAPTVGWGKAYTTQVPDDFPSTLTGYEKVLIQFTDMSGSGTPQLVRIDQDSVTYWPSLGYGKFGRGITMKHAPDFGENFTTSRLILGDLDGSGTMDLVYMGMNAAYEFDPMKAVVFLNQSGNSFSAPFDIQLPIPYDALDQVQVTDILGNGTNSLLISKLHSPTGPKHWYIDLCAARKPYLLHRVDNQRGATTDITYRSSVYDYLRDKAAGQSWITKLPFPVHVVAQVTHTDHLAGSTHTQKYTYHHGYYDGVEREFRGFGRVEVQDAEGINVSQQDALDLSNTAPSLTKTWYYTGAAPDVLSQHIKKEFFQDDPDAFILPPNSVDLNQYVQDTATQAQLYRALKGRTYRQEVYGLGTVPDATTGHHEQDSIITFPTVGPNETPYTVAITNYCTRIDQLKGDNAYALFCTYAEQTLVHTYERDATDPQVHHQCTLEVDAYGHVIQSCAVAYGRRKQTAQQQVAIQKPQDRLSMQTAVEQQQTLKITLNKQAFAHEASPSSYVLGIPYESQIYEISPPTHANAPDLIPADAYNPAAAFTLEQLKKYLTKQQRTLTPTQPSSAQARLRHWERTYYAQIDARGQQHTLPLGKLSLIEKAAVIFPVLPLQQLTAAFEQNELADLWEGTCNTEDLIALLQTGHYTNDQKVGSQTVLPNYWWHSSDQAVYTQSGSTPKDHFFEPMATLDSAGYKTTYIYDDTVLFLQQTTDPVGNTHKVLLFDYQHMHPLVLQDANANVHEVQLDALGRVRYTSFFGTEKGERAGFTQLYDLTASRPIPLTDPKLLMAESLEDIIQDPKRYLTSSVESDRHASYFYYDEWAFTHSQQPAASLFIAATQYAYGGCTIQNTDTPYPIALAYSDGFGRMLQSKAEVDPGTAFIYTKETGEVAKKPAYSAQRWLTSGRVAYNNKGLPVRKYEPYYTNTYQYLSTPLLDNFGVSNTLYYDPINRHICTLTAKGFLTHETFNAWQHATYDENDSILGAPYYKANQDPENPPDKNSVLYPYYEKDLSEDARKSLAQSFVNTASRFANTPDVTYIDNLSHTILTRRTKYIDEDKNNNYLDVHYSHDILGRLLNSTDPRLFKSQQGLQDTRLEGADPARFNELLCYSSLGGGVLKTMSVDSGTHWGLANAFGQTIYTNDSRGTVLTMKYDALQRPKTIHVQKQATPQDPLTLDQDIAHYIYGDAKPEDLGMNPATSRGLNLRGALYQHYDTAGLISIDATQGYSLLGTAFAQKRRFCKDYKATVSWDTITDHIAHNTTRTADILQETGYTNTRSYDALGRVVQETDPDGNITHPYYDPIGRPQQLHVTPVSSGQETAYVKAINYNARSQRTHIQYGNGTSTTCTYEPTTFRLTQQLTAKLSPQVLQYFAEESTTLTSQQLATDLSAGQPLQDVHYTYDPVGNVTAKTDRALTKVFYNNQQVDSTITYTYDAIYQLIQATGNEHIGQTAEIAGKELPSTLPNPPSEKDQQALQNYLERYTYDDGGNLTKRQHMAGSNSWTRNIIIAPDSNRGVDATIKGQAFVANPATPEVTKEFVDQYFDAVGNQLYLAKTDPTHPLKWDFRNQLDKAPILSHDNGTEDAEYYVYDGGGQRVRKVLETYGHSSKQCTAKEVLYLRALERRSTLTVAAARMAKSSVPGERFIDTEELFLQGVTSNGTSKVKNAYYSLRITDDTQSIARHDYGVRDKAGNPFPMPSALQAAATAYHLDDRLNSCTVEVDTNGQEISREVYYPYGGTALFIGSANASTLKHYRYSGKERDSITGLYYYGARYYAPWLARWLKPDPAGTVNGLNLYAFVEGNPVTDVDVGGMMGKQGSAGERPTTLKRLAGEQTITFMYKKFELMAREKERVISFKRVEKDGNEVVIMPLSEGSDPKAYILGYKPEGPLKAKIKEIEEIEEEVARRENTEPGDLSLGNISIGKIGAEVEKRLDQGSQLPIAYIDIPKHPKKGEPKFLFTGILSGCSIVFTTHPKEEDQYRVFHNPIPDDKGLNLHESVVMSVVSTEYKNTNGLNLALAFAEYSSQDKRWHLVAQVQKVDQEKIKSNSQTSGEYPLIRDNRVITKTVDK